MKVLKWLDNNLEQAILLILLCGMTIVMGGQIIARYAFSASLSWSEEITRYMFIISGFISKKVSSSGDIHSNEIHRLLEKPHVFLKQKY